MKKEIEEDEGGAAFPMSPPSLGLPSPSASASTSSAAAAAARVLARPMPALIPGLRAPSPFVRAMGTRVDPQPPQPLTAPPRPRPRPLPPPPPPIPEKRRRGRPRNCDRLLLPPPGFHLAPSARAPPPALPAHGQPSSRHHLFPDQLGGFQPHVLKIHVGEDIVSKIVQVSKIIGKAVCVLSVFGAVQDCYLLHSAVTLNHKGPLEIIHVFGSILTSDSPGFGCLSVTLACGDCSVIGGVAVGPLIAATPVQAIVGSFHNDAFQANKKPKLIACYPSSHVPTGYGVTHTVTGSTPYLSSQVAVGTGSMCCTNSKVTIGSWRKHDPSYWFPIRNGSTNHSNSQVTVGNGSTHHPSSQVNVGNGSTHHPNSQVTFGNGSTHHPNSQVTIDTRSTRCLSFEVGIGSWSKHDPSSWFPIGVGSTNHSNFQATVGDGSTHHSSSQVTIGTRSTQYPSYQVPIGNGSTYLSDSHVTKGDRSTSICNSQATVGYGIKHQPDSRVTVGNGSTSNANSQDMIGHGSTQYPESLPAIGDGSMNNANSEVLVGDGSTNKGNSQDILVDGNTNSPSSKVYVGNGSSCCPNSRVAVGDRSAPPSEVPNPEYASCTVVEHGGPSEIDVKPSQVMA